MLSTIAYRRSNSNYLFKFRLGLKFFFLQQQQHLLKAILRAGPKKGIRLETTMEIQIAFPQNSIHEIMKRDGSQSWLGKSYKRIKPMFT